MLMGDEIADSLIPVKMEMLGFNFLIGMCKLQKWPNPVLTINQTVKAPLIWLNKGSLTRKIKDPAI